MQQDLPPSLPTPDADSAAHSEHTAAYIRDHIAAAGGIPGDSLVEIDCIAYI